MEITKKVLKSILLLDRWVKSENYCGWDPYDGLNSNLTSKLIRNEGLSILVIQVNLYSPINIRPLLKIKKGHSNKALALFSNAYLNLYYVTKAPRFREDALKLLEFLLNNNLYKNKDCFCCSSYYFTYIAPQHILNPNIPDIICVTECAKTFFKAYEVLGEDFYLNIAMKACDYMLDKLFVCSNNSCYFKYTPLENSKIVFNVSALALSVLANLLKYHYRSKIINVGEKVVGFLLAHQRKDGVWPYSLSLPSKRYYWQIDYHQGFIIDGLLDFIPYIREKDLKLRTIESITKAVNFYIHKQFDENGRSYYRYPYKYPIDIHNQAQGIITSLKLFNILKSRKYLQRAIRITKWTIDNMQDPRGYFYAHKYPWLTNKIPYMRWSQAWIMLALTMLFCNSFMNNEFKNL
ncbi:MAG: hypothetical protein QXG36_09080 [Nitrososphaeria archaeon]